MKNKILTALLFIAVLINMSIVPIYANESKRDAYNFDFSVCDDKTAIVKINVSTACCTISRFSAVSQLSGKLREIDAIF